MSPQIESLTLKVRCSLGAEWYNSTWEVDEDIMATQVALSSGTKVS